MTEITKQAKPAQKVKPEQPKKAEAALEDKQLDTVTGGSLYEACATGKHLNTGKIT